MVKTKLLENLSAVVEPYLFFWREWIGNGNCNLDKREIEVIDKHLNNDFKMEFLELLTYNESTSEIRAILRKLELGYPVFREFVVLHFLQTIMDMAAQNGRDSFLKTPIHQLNLDTQLKNCLSKFNCHTLQLVFIVYKADDFSRAWFYNIIVEFQTIQQNVKALNADQFCTWSELKEKFME